MKKLNLVLAAMFFFVLISFTSSQAVINYSIYYGVQEANGIFNKTNIPVNGVRVEVYNCLNMDCTGVNPVPFYTTQTNNNRVTIIYPTKLQQYGYALYAYKENYIGWEERGITWAGSGSTNGQNIYLSQKREKTANITRFSGTNVSNCINVSADIVSPVADIRQTNIPLKENATVNVILEVYHNNSLVLSQTKTEIFQYSERKAVDYSYCGTSSSGNYTFVLHTDILDSKIINKVRDTEILTFIVGGNDGDNGDDDDDDDNGGDDDNQTGGLFIRINSPKNKTYSQNLILVNITTNGSASWFSWNGQNVSYTGPMFMIFNNGSNTIHAWANNSLGEIVYANKTFFVNRTISDGDDDDDNGGDDDDDKNSGINITIHYPFDNIIINTSSVLLNASSNVTVTHWQYQLNNGSYVLIYGPSLNLTTNVTGLINGTNTLRVCGIVGTLFGCDSVVFQVNLGSNNNGDDDSDSRNSKCHSCLSKYQTENSTNSTISLGMAKDTQYTHLSKTREVEEQSQTFWTLINLLLVVAILIVLFVILRI